MTARPKHHITGPEWRRNTRGVCHLYQRYRPRLDSAISWAPLCGDDSAPRTIKRLDGDEYCQACIKREGRQL